MNTDLHLTSDELRPIEVTIFDEDPEAVWGTIRLRGPECHTTLYMTRAQLHELSHNIVDALQAADAERVLAAEEAIERRTIELAPLKCDHCQRAVIVVDDRYKHADPTDVTKDGWYSCSILTAALAGSALVASVNGALYTDVQAPA